MHVRSDYCQDTFVRRVGMRRIIWFPVLLVVGGCGIFGVVCTDEARPGLILTVQDSITGAPVVGEAIATALLSAYADTAHFSGDAASEALLYERPGRYRIDVMADEYQPWTRTSVRIPETEDECHVRTVRLTARLQSEQN